MYSIVLFGVLTFVVIIGALVWVLYKNGKLRQTSTRDEDLYQRDVPVIATPLVEVEEITLDADCVLRGLSLQDRELINSWEDESRESHGR